MCTMVIDYYHEDETSVTCQYNFSLMLCTCSIPLPTLHSGSKEFFLMTKPVLRLHFNLFIASFRASLSGPKDKSHIGYCLLANGWV